MSYLNSPRLTFAGQFQADPSTVNNDPNHFNNAAFKPEYQQYQTKNNPNGWWNPDGTGNWRFLGCKVTSVTYKDGTSTADTAEDSIIGMPVMDADSRVAGKIVDLDPQQQSVSQIWGLTVRIVNGEICLVKGDFEPVAFNDIWWARNTGGGASAIPPSAAYQSVLKNLEFAADVTGSRFLKELKEQVETEGTNSLSIKFNVDTFNMDNTSSQFTLGRIVGTIGPEKKAEPLHFAIGRQLIPDLTNPSYLPVNNGIYMACAFVDEANSQVVLDLGNSLATSGPEGAISETRDLVLAVKKDPDYVHICTIDYKIENWYKGNGGLVTIKLTPEQLVLVQQFPLAIIDGSIPQPVSSSLIEEAADYVRADQFVFRMNPGEDCVINFYASHLGKPHAGQTIICEFQNSLINIMGQGNGTPSTSTPNILSFAESIITDESGKATLKVNAGDPKNPRAWVDGQVYALWYYLKGQPTADFSIDLTTGTVLPSNISGINPTNFISILVFDSVRPESVENPNWEFDIWPIMQQYANLYPLMSKGIFNLANQQVVHDNAEILKFVFSKEKTDPNYMPVTRDLSGDKQKMIINYLDRILKSSAPKETVTFRKL